MSCAHAPGCVRAVEAIRGHQYGPARWSRSSCSGGNDEALSPTCLYAACMRELMRKLGSSIDLTIYLNYSHCSDGTSVRAGPGRSARIVWPLISCRWTEPRRHATKARPREAGLPEMSSLAIALIVTAVIAAGGVLGLVLQRVLPERYTTDKARDMIGGRRRATDASARSGQRPPHLDRLWRFQHAADRAPDDRGARARVRSRNAPVRPRGG